MNSFYTVLEIGEMVNLGRKNLKIKEIIHRLLQN